MLVGGARGSLVGGVPGVEDSGPVAFLVVVWCRCGPASGVPPLGGAHPLTGVRVGSVTGSAPAGLINAQQPGQRRFIWQHHGCHHGERGSNRRPGQAMIPRGLRYRAPAVSHRHPGRAWQPRRDPHPGRHLRHRPGKRGSPAAPGPAVPAPLVPDQPHRRVGPAARSPPNTSGPATACGSPGTPAGPVR